MRSAFFLPVVAMLTGETQASAQAASADPGSIPSIEQWMSLKGAGAPRISPDGQFVAYAQSEANWAADGMEREIWVVEIASGRTTQLTDGPRSSWSPAWSPDSRRLLFLSNRGGASQIYSVAASGGEPVQLLAAENGVDAFVWSPDGRKIAYTTSSRVEEVGQESEAAEARFQIVGRETKFTSALWMADVPAGIRAAAAPTRLLDGGEFAVDDPAWSPDSTRIAFTTYDYRAANVLDSYAIRSLNLANMSVTLVADRKGPDLWPVWSPDGSRIAFRTAVLRDDEEYFDYSFGYVAVAPATGGASQILTQTFDERPTPVGWSSEGIYFSARRRTDVHLFRLNPATGAISQVSGPPGSINSAFSFSGNYRSAAFMRADRTSLPEVNVSSLASFRPVAMTHFSRQLSGWTLGTREMINWTSRDGTPIEGVLIKPPGFDPSRRYPLLVVLHGGPQDVDQPIYYTRGMPYPVEQFAARGALILLPNYRGSVGYGQRFAAALVRSQGIPQYEDVIGGVDLLIAQGIVDRGRVGAMGWSHGGYLASFFTTYSDRFRAISMGAGVSDWRHFFSAGGGTALAFERGYMRAAPWEDPDYYRAVAPFTYIARASTPTLIQHGRNDPVAPIIGAYEMYRGLKDRGVPVEMIVYENAGHLPSGLRQSRAATQHNWDWFERWIWSG